MNDMNDTNQADPFFNLELEQQLLGAVLVNNDTFNKLGSVRAEHFVDPVHQDIWRNIAARIHASHLASPVTLKIDLESHEGLAGLGGPSYLARLAGASISGFAAPDYAAELAELHSRREINTLLSAQIEGLRLGGRADDARSAVEVGLQGLEDVSGTPRASTFLKATIQAIEHIDKAYQTGNAGIPTGIADLDKLIGGLVAENFVIIAGDTSMGKAQPLTSQIKTMSDWKRMGKIAVGDKIASIDGKPSEVVGVFPQGVKDVYELTYYDGRKVRCSDEHLWKIQSASFAADRVVDTIELKRLVELESYSGRISTPLPSGDFGGGDLPLDPWFLGFILGDGCLVSGVRFSTPDAAILFRLQKMFGFEAIKYMGSYDYSITTPMGQPNPLLDTLRELGLIGKRSPEKFIPPEFMSASRADRLSLLQGLMDSDGWVEKFGAVRLASSSEVMAKQVQELVWSLGGVCSISVKPTKRLDSFVLNIRHPEPGTLMTLIHKKRRAVRVKPVRATIVSVELVGREECQCIAVSHPSHLYLTDGYIATHNTAVATAIAHNVAKSGYGVGFASLEMSDAELAMRINSIESKTAYQKMRNGDINEEEFRSLMQTAKNQESLPIHIYNSQVRTVGAIMSEAKRSIAMMKPNGDFKGFGVLIVDYIQLIRGKGQGRYEVVTEISQQLKAMAKVLGVPVIGIAQLSRGFKQRDDMRPHLSDLKDSSQLEQDADAVIFCYRDHYYLERQEPPKDIGELALWEEAKEASKNVMELIVAKQRMGAVGKVRVGCDIKTNRFWDLGHQGKMSFE